MPAHLENSAVATGLERSIFIPIPKKGNAKECSNYNTIALISLSSKAMLKILQAGLQQYVSQKLPDIQAGFRKGRTNRSHCQHLLNHIKSKRILENNNNKIYFCFTDYTKVFDCELQQTGKFFKDMGISEHLTCLLRNLYTSQEATVRTTHGATDWFQIEKGVPPGCIMSPCLFNLYAEYIMGNAGLDEAQAGIKIAERNINNLR